MCTEKQILIEEIFTNEQKMHLSQQGLSGNTDW